MTELLKSIFKDKERLKIRELRRLKRHKDPRTEKSS